MYAVDGVVYVCAVVLSDLYIVNKSNAPRDEWGVTEQKNERAECRVRERQHEMSAEEYAAERQKILDAV